MIKLPKENLYTVPNILSFYRLISFPVVLYFILANNESIFVILLIINLITDFLDGFIARRFNMQTDFGAKLDSLADDATYLLAFIGLFVFKIAEFEPYKISASLFLLSYVTSLLVSLIKFGRMPSLHLYSSKVGAVLQGSFFFVLFIFGFYTWFYYIVVILGIASFSEQIIILVFRPEMKSDTKGLYWVLKNK
jgi:CDP-diacylglycerol--glycerol-3-phosphate 3-phosphatidyltransferase